MDSKFIYLYDPLCGWCYGFSSHLQKFHKAHQQVPIEVFSGGMVVGSRVGPLSQMAQYIKDALKRVESLSGVKFGEHFMANLNNGSEMIFDSEPPSRAGLILKEFSAHQELEIAHTIQEIIYKEGKDPNISSSYHLLAKKIGITPDLFDEYFSNHSFSLGVQDEFSHVKKFGVSGYPTLIYHSNNQYYLLSNGFTKTENLERTYQAILDAIQ